MFYLLLFLYAENLGSFLSHKVQTKKEPPSLLTRQLYIESLFTSPVANWFLANIIVIPRPTCLDL